MGKFKNTLVKEIKAEQERERQQTKLRSKHHVESENVLVVEKANLFKFMIRTAGQMIRTCATIVIFLLAVTGLLALVYPEVRTELFQVLQRISSEMLNYIK